MVVFFAVIGMFAVLAGISAGIVGILELFSFMERTNSQLERLSKLENRVFDLELAQINEKVFNEAQD
jgi:hypothetical protein